MNKKKKIQLIILCVIFLLLAAVFAALKAKGVKEMEETEEGETYQALEIDPQQVMEIGIIGSEGTVNLVKEGEDWKCLEDGSISIDESSVEIFLEKASSIVSDTKIEQVTDMAQYGLDEAAVNITLQWDDNMYTIRLGDYNSMISSYYLCINKQDIVYAVDSSLYFSLNKTLEDFKAAEIFEEEQPEN